MLKAIKPYEICYPDPLVLQGDDTVKIIKSEDDSSEWFGWHFCSNQDGKEGWISIDFMTINKLKGKIVKPYTAKELEAEIGQEFTVLNESCGWYWCKNNSGDKGWLPINIFVK